MVNKERWRVAANQFPAAHFPGGRGTPEEPGRCGDHDDICEPLHQSGVAAGGVAAFQYRRLQQALHRREIPDQSEQGLTARPRYTAVARIFREVIK